MNDKEKQIEEMAKDIVRSAGLDVYQKAEYFIGLGYQKPPEDKVVLSREEYEKFLKVNSELAVLEKSISTIKQEARKETAEKLIKFVSEHCDNETLIWQLDEFVAKSLGVEIKE